MIIDASNLIVGRLATTVAKKALQGEKIDIVKCENALITGSKKQVLSKYKHKREIGKPLTGPYYSRLPDRFVRRIIRGMLPYKKEKGKKAFNNIICYIGIPSKYKVKKLDSISEANISNSNTLNYVKVGDICKLLGAKI